MRRAWRISIHALLAESDRNRWCGSSGPSHFYPRSPCGERLHARKEESGVNIFLSTLSLRRATLPVQWAPRSQLYFYPRSPCGERLRRCGVVDRRILISIHALLAESDDVHAAFLLSGMKFLSTLSLRRATGDPHPHGQRPDISIHALLAESDTQELVLLHWPIIFLSTLSLRRATSRERRNASAVSFLSTLSLRRATAKVHKTVGHFCAYETNFMEIASSC